MGEKFSIYAGPPIAAALACLGEDYAENRSGRLNTVAERYLAMVADELARLDLSHSEWCAIMDANNGVEQYTGDAGVNAVMLWANVHDTRELGVKWKIDQAELVRKLQQLPKSTLTAILEVCDRFWSRSGMPTDEALSASGVTLPSLADTVE